MKYIFIFSIFLGNIAYSNTYFVSTSGLSTNPGTIAQPWSISHAFSNTLANDTVWVKAGNYGVQNLILNASNTTFIGYKNFPWEITPAMPDSLSTFLLSNYDLVYPTIDGANRATAGTGINFGSNKTNITIKNFQIRNYQMGMSIVGRDNLIENIMEQGNPLTKYGDTDYYIYITANTNTKQGKYNVVEYCYLERISRRLAHVGHGGHGFSLTISYNHKPCLVGGGYCYDVTQKDYVVENNIIRNCTSKNVDECVMLRGDKVKYNLIEDVTSLSYGTFRIQNSSSYNKFNRCKIKNSYYWKDPSSSSIYRTPGFDFLASYYGDSTALNISSMETNSYPWELKLAGHHNTISNSIFDNVSAAVAFNNYSDFTYPSYHPLNGQAVDRINRKRVESNSFINCTFIALKIDTLTTSLVNRPALFTAMRGNSNNVFSNCIFDGFYNFESRNFAINTTTTVVSLHGIIPTNVSFKHCLFNGNNFDSQIISNGTLNPVIASTITAGANNQVAGTFSNCIVNDPLFVDRINRNYHLIVTSPCIDAGTSVALADDFDKNFRPNGVTHDIGAYEFHNLLSIQDNEHQDNVVSIYPNPSNSFINVKLDLNFVGSLYSIYDITGKVIVSGLIKSENTIVDMSYLSNGIYMFRVGESLKQTFKVLKQ